MTSANAWRDEQRAKHRALTDLNRATTAAYRRCRGRHLPSEQTVDRDDAGILRQLHVCAKCGVPIVKRGSGRPGGLR